MDCFPCEFRIDTHREEVAGRNDDHIHCFFCGVSCGLDQFLDRSGGDLIVVGLEFKPCLFHFFHRLKEFLDLFDDEVVVQDVLFGIGSRYRLVECQHELALILEWIGHAAS